MNDNRRNWRNAIMTMADLASYARHAPSTSDLLDWIGLERRRSRGRRTASRAGWIGLGLCVGTGLTMLLTPRRGPEMRERLAEKARRAREYVAPHEEDRGDARARPPSSGRAATRI